MWWILGRYFTRIPLAHHPFCPKLCILMNFWTTSICLSMQYLIEGSRSSFQSTIQNLRICGPLCARDWWLLHHQPKINTSMKSLPNQLYLFHRSRLIVRLSIFQRTSVSLWDLFLYFYGMQIVWVILPHEYRCLQCRRHKHCPYYRMFVAVFCCIRLFLPLSLLIIHPVQEWSWS